MYNKEALRKLLEDCWGACIENTMRPHSDRYEKPPKHPDRDTYITSQLSAMEQGDKPQEEIKELFEQEAESRYPVKTHIDRENSPYKDSKATFLRGCGFGYKISAEGDKWLDEGGIV